MSRQTDLEANTNRTPEEDSELSTLQTRHHPRVLRPDEEGYVMGKTTYAPDERADVPYVTGPQHDPRLAPNPTPPATPDVPMQQQRPRADGTVPVKGDKDFIRYAGPDKD